MGGEQVRDVLEALGPAGIDRGRANARALAAGARQQQPERWAMPRDMSGYSTLEAAMLAAIHATGLPEPVAEHHFDWCCEHVKPLHGLCLDGEGHPMEGFPLCNGCLRPYLCDGREWDDARELAFHEYAKGRKWAFDFAYPDLKLAIECEGGTYSGGRHTTGAGFEKDAEKYGEAAARGWTVLRFTQRQITSGAALELLQRALTITEISG